MQSENLEEKKLIEQELAACRLRIAALESQLETCSSVPLQMAEIRKIFEYTPVPTYMWRVENDKYIFADCNKEAVSFSGQDILLLFGKTPQELFPDIPQIIECLDQCSKTKQALTAEFELPVRFTGKAHSLKVHWNFVEPDIILSHIYDLTYQLENEERLLASARKLEILHALSKSISMANTVSEMAWKTVDELHRQLEVDLAVFYVRKGEELYLEAERSTGLHFPPADQLHHKVGECLCGMAAEQGISYYSEDIHKDPRCTHNECKNVGLRSFAAIPLRVTGDNLGVVGLGLRTQRDFSQYAELLESVGAVISTGLHGAILYEKVSQYADTLENRVKERTCELESANQLLRKEIVERMQAERERSQSQEAFITFVNHFPGMVYIKNNQGKLMFVNQQMMEELGAESWLGLSPDQYLPHDQALRFIEHDNMALGDQFVTREEVIIDLKGRSRNWRMAKFPIKREKSPWLIGCVAVEVTELVHSREELVASEKKFRMLFEESRDAIVLVDFHSGEILEANNQTAFLLGKSRDEIVGRGYLELFPPENQETCREVFEKLDLMHGGMPNEFEVLRKDGKRVPVELTSKRMSLMDRDVVQGLFRDITWRRKSEKDLRESEERFRELAENIDDVFWVALPDFSKLLYAGVQFEKVWGQPLDSFRNNVILLKESIVEEDLHLLSSFTQDALQKNFEVECRIRRPDGNIRHLRHRGFPVKDAHGKVSRIVGITQDITVAKLHELSLKREKETEFALTGLSGKLLKVKDIDENSKLIFQTALEQTHSERGFIGRTDSQQDKLIFHSFDSAGWHLQTMDKQAPDDEAIPDDWKRVLGSREAYYHNVAGWDSVRWREKTDNQPAHSFLTAPAMIGDRFVGQLYLANATREYDERDLSLIKRLATLFALSLQRNEYETDIIVAKLEAERANSAKSDFLAKMSHEIRTPMNAIIGLTRVVQDSLTDSELRDYLDTTLLAADNLMGIIDNVLDLSKIEADMMELEVTHFNLSGLLSEITTLAELQLREKELKFSYEMAPDVPVYLKGDRSRLRQVLINLVGNAIKFTETGEIQLRLDRIPAEDSAGRVKLHFVISDTGPGIPLESQNQVFNKFIQLDDSTTRKFGGSGLGLTICRQLVELMGGEIWLESTPGHGSTFHFTIECEPGVVSIAECQYQPVFPEKSNDKSLRVLVVDDNESNLKVAAALLKRLGHRPTIVQSAQAAFTCLQTSTVDVILMDLEMPEMDGLEATVQIRAGVAGKGNAGLPIIALTAHALAGFKERCLEVGMSDFLSKPVDIRQLATKLGCVNAPLEKQESVSPKLQLSGFSVLDREEAVLRFDGDSDLYEEISEAFFAELPERLQKIAISLENGEQSPLALSLHSLKSHCGTIGAKFAQDIAAQLESLARRGDLPGVAAGLGSLKQALDAVVKAFRNE